MRPAPQDAQNGEDQDKKNYVNTVQIEDTACKLRSLCKVLLYNVERKKEIARQPRANIQGQKLNRAALFYIYWNKESVFG